jgi:alpha-mannosidase
LTDSLLTLEPSNVVLSGVKAASDGSGDVVVRVYETAGRATEAALTVAGMTEAAACDLREKAGGDLPVSGGQLSLALKPFEIRTVRVRRSAGKKAA